MKKDNWTYKVFLFTFLLAAIFTALTNLFDSINIFLLITIILLVIIIGIIFDMIGVATLTSKEENFHARASKKIKGAKEAITLLKNASKVSSFCNDVIGDICGIVSGGLGTTLAIVIANKFHFNLFAVLIVISSLISALTVGFKAIFKNTAIKYSDNIVFMVGKLKRMLNIK